jgi:hypothetical protein
VSESAQELDFTATSRAVLLGLPTRDRWAEAGNCSTGLGECVGASAGLASAGVRMRVQLYDKTTTRRAEV